MVGAGRGERVIIRKKTSTYVSNTQIDGEIHRTGSFAGVMDLSARLHEAVGSFMGPASVETKVATIARAFDGGASVADVAAFMRERRTLSEMLDFIATHRGDRPSLPLHLHAHIRQLVHNPLLQPDTTLPVERVRHAGWMRHLPDELQYVLLRLPEEALPYDTPSGWQLISDSRRATVQDGYREGAENNVWRTRSAVIVARRYVGMGHVRVVGYVPPPVDAFFQFVEGGANGHDRELHFQQAQALTEHTMQRVSWRETFDYLNPTLIHIGRRVLSEES